MGRKHKDEIIYVLKSQKNKELIAWAYKKKYLKKYAKQRKINKYRINQKELSSKENQFFAVYNEEYEIIDCINGYYLTGLDSFILEDLKHQKLAHLNSVRNDLKHVLKDFVMSEKDKKTIAKAMKVLKKYSDEEDEKKINKIVRFKDIIRELFGMIKKELKKEYELYKHIQNKKEYFMIKGD